MGIFKKKKKKVNVRFNFNKACRVTLKVREQLETVNALNDGDVYSATGYIDRFGCIDAVKLDQYPKVTLPASIFDFV